MPRQYFWKPTRFPNGIETGVAKMAVDGAGVSVIKNVTVTVVDGAAAGTFTLPTAAIVTGIGIETPVTIPGTPTTTNISLGSAAAGAQYVAAVDAKTQGWISSTLLYPARNPEDVVHYTVVSAGGTAASQDGTIILHVGYYVPVT